MRNVTVSGGFTIMCVIATLGLLENGASAKTITLKGTYSAGQIDMACINASGTVTAGTGSGGYGCKGPGGSVSCTAGGKCTGTCSKCSARRVSGKGVREVLRSRNIDVKSTGTSAPTDGKVRPGTAKTDTTERADNSNQTTRMQGSAGSSR